MNGYQSKNPKITLAIIGEKVSKIEKWIDNADTNHFPSIEKRFDDVDDQFSKIQIKMAYWSGGLAALMVVIGILTTLWK